MRFLFCFLLATPFAGAQLRDRPGVEVLVPWIQPPMDAAFFKARAVAARIFSEIGVEIRWHRRSSSAECSQNPRRIVITLSSNTPAGFHPGALAFSKPFATRGACITILMDRLSLMQSENPVMTASLLGHVLAHEMAHVLQASDRHSDSGVLKQAWSTSEIRNMPLEQLSFTEQDAMLILESLGASKGLHRGSSDDGSSSEQPRLISNSRASVCGRRAVVPR